MAVQALNEHFFSLIISTRDQSYYKINTDTLSGKHLQIFQIKQQ